MNDGCIPIGRSLSSIVEESSGLPQVRKGDLQPGDCVFIKTCNSRYAIRVLEGGAYLVSGGWFDQKAKSPMRVGITGCTWGGSAVKIDVVAACGLCLEFGNRVRTSAIQRVFLLPRAAQN
jgi:hypothetical protein